MNLIKKNVQNLKPYIPGEQINDNFIKLNTNENPYLPSPLIDKALEDFYKGKNLNLYPDPVSNELREIISEKYDINKENIIVSNGSDEILAMIIRCFAEVDDTICVPYPSYLLYKILADIHNIETKEVYFDNDYSIDFNKIISLNPKIFFLANPNSPSGTIIKKDVIEEFLSKFKGILVVDEAYVDFSDENCLDLLEKYENIIIIRTLSKSFSLAGIRLGYSFANKEIINNLFKIKDSYNINCLTQKIAKTAFMDMQNMKDNVCKINSTKQRVISKLNDLGFYIYPSSANFIFVKHEEKTGKYLYQELKNRNILVRYFDMSMLTEGIRVTIGKDEDMDRFLNVINKIINM